MATSVLLAPNCNTCHSSHSLRSCAGCKVMQYCSAEHQTSDQNDHRADCEAVQKARRECESEELILRAAPGENLHNMTTTDPFTNSVGRFWDLILTRNYMSARFELVKRLVGRINNHASICESLEHLIDMLRLCHRDQLGVRAIAPYLMLRLGKHQECYDFVKYWSVISHPDNTLPLQPDLENGDAFEPINIFSHGCLSYLVPIAIVKINLLVDLQTLQHARVLLAKAPLEIVETVRMYACHTTIVSGDPRMIFQGAWKHQINTLKTQISSLLILIHHANPQFLEALFDPNTYLQKAWPQDGTSRRSSEELKFVLKQSYDAWRETDGALEIIRSMMDSEGIGAQSCQFRSGSPILPPPRDVCS